jgi:two-component system response regulator PilR (NtrC family)
MATRLDGDPVARRKLAAHLSQESYEVVEAPGVAHARRELAANALDAVITDHTMGDGGGLDVLAAARESDPAIAVVLVAGYATLEFAAESMRRGAFNFITKPFSPELLSATTGRAVEHTRLRRENGLLREAVIRLTLREKFARATEPPPFEDLAELLPETVNLRTLLATLEKALLQRALKAAGGAQAVAARKLGLSRSDMAYKLSKFGIRNS